MTKEVLTSVLTREQRRALTREQRRARIRAQQEERERRNAAAVRIIHATRFDPLRPLHVDNRTASGEVDDSYEHEILDWRRKGLCREVRFRRNMLLFRIAAAVSFLLAATLTTGPGFVGVGIFWTIWAIHERRKLRIARERLALLDPPPAKVLP